jgi:hypothetical protein
MREGSCKFLVNHTGAEKIIIDLQLCFQKLQRAFVNVDGGKAILDKYPRGSLREHLQDASALLQDLESQQSALASSATSDPNQLGFNVLQLSSTVEKIVEKVFFACCKTRKKIRQQKFLNALRIRFRINLVLWVNLSVEITCSEVTTSRR